MQVYQTHNGSRSAYVTKVGKRYIVYTKRNLFESGPSADHDVLEDAIKDADHYVQYGCFT